MGTGKTRTPVAAILEIVRSTDSCVLVSCNYNAACDEIAERLVDHLTSNEIIRIFAKSHGKDKISPKIRPICNMINGQFKFPAFEFLYKFRVVISTLLTAGSFVRGRSIDKNFNSSHFSHVFIDEAASVHETVTLIPISKLCNKIFNFSIELPFKNVFGMPQNISLRRHHCRCQLINDFGTKNLFIDFFLNSFVFGNRCS